MIWILIPIILTAWLAFMIIFPTKWAYIVDKENSYWIKKGVLKSSIANVFSSFEKGIGLKILVAIGVMLFLAILSMKRIESYLICQNKIENEVQAKEYIEKLRSEIEQGRDPAVNVSLVNWLYENRLVFPSVTNVSSTLEELNIIMSVYMGRRTHICQSDM